MQDSSEKAKRIRQLAEIIDKANTAYWSRNEQSLDDSVYDQYVEELKHLDPDNDVLKGMASDPVGDKKVRHAEHMYSLDKVYEWADLVAWAKSVARSPNEMFRLSPKYDGISLEVFDGRLVTRGNGEVGNDITHLAPWITMRVSNTTRDDLLPTVIDSSYWKTHRHVGELLITFDMFNKLKNSFVEFRDYKTPRNMVSGFANLKANSPILKKLTLNGAPDGKPYRVMTWVMHTSKELACPLSKLAKMEESTISKLKRHLNCPTDGIVCRLEDDQYAKSLGFTMHHPNGAIAFKFTDEVHKTIVTGIRWQVGNESVTPIAELEPVVIDGVTVTRVTCHNTKFVIDNSLAIGSKVSIVRRGGVIPKIVAVSNDEPADCVIPQICPECGQPLVYKEPDTLCVNDTCPGRCTSKIVKGLYELGIEGIGPSIVGRIVRELHIPNIMTWCLETWDAELLKAKGFTAHEIRTIISEIQRTVENGASDEDILVSLCIPMVGRSFSASVIKYSGGIMNLIGKSPDEIHAMFHEVPRINSTALKGLIDFLNNDATKNEFEAYYNLFTHLKPADAPKRTKYCITGTLPDPRRIVERWICEHGGMPTANIREADYLVSSSPVSMSTKMKYARDHNIPVISFEEMKNQLSKQS